MCYRNASGGVIDQQAVIIDGTSQVAVNLWINDITENAVLTFTIPAYFINPTTTPSNVRQ